MNKILLAAAMSLALTGAASAHHRSAKRAELYTFPPATIVTPHGTVVTAPPGWDVDADIENGNDVSVDLAPAGKGLLGLGVLGL